ncbi:methyltransferase, partial [Candidatus Nomurabacteria bacterium]|nr:methyltransferase [Candidatus Nomurabacteria bacterium]
GYTLILSNPPYHTDFSVAKHFIEKGFNRLVLGGRMVMVTKRRDWYRNKFIAVFGGVSIREKDGYFVFAAEKRSSSYAGRNAI